MPASPSATSAAAGSGRGTGQTQQTLLGASRIPAGRGHAAVIAAIGIEVPGGRVVQLGCENRVESAAAGPVAYRRHHLDPPAEGSRPPNRGARRVTRGG